MDRECKDCHPGELQGTGLMEAECAVSCSLVNERLRMTIVFDEPDEAGWIVARVVEVPGALSQGRTREEARKNVLDALQVVLAPDDQDDLGLAGRSEPLDLTVVR